MCLVEVVWLLFGANMHGSVLLGANMAQWHSIMRMHSKMWPSVLVAHANPLMHVTSDSSSVLAHVGG